MHRADAFEDEVDAYPAITVLRHAGQDQAIVATAGQNNLDFSKHFLVNPWNTQGLVPLNDYRACVPIWKHTACGFEIGTSASARRWVGTAPLTGLIHNS